MEKLLPPRAPSTKLFNIKSNPPLLFTTCHLGFPLRRPMPCPSPRVHPISFLPGGIDGQYHQLSMARSETNQWSLVGAPEVASYPIQGITAVPLASSGQLSKSRVTKWFAGHTSRTAAPSCTSLATEAALPSPVLTRTPLPLSFLHSVVVGRKNRPWCCLAQVWLANQLCLLQCSLRPPVLSLRWSFALRSWQRPSS